MDIEEVHSLLDQVESVINDLRNDKRDEVDTVDLYELSYLVQSVTDWGATPSQLGIAPALLNRVQKMRGQIKVRDALIVADRVRGWVRTFDQRSQEHVQLSEPNSSELAAPERQSKQIPRDANFSFDAERWTLVGSSSETKAKIQALSFLLGNILEQTAQSNLPPDEQILTEFERRQLIALLETALALLKAPMVEKSLLQKVGEMLKRAAGSAAEKGVQKGVGKLAEAAGDKLADLFNGLF